MTEQRSANRPGHRPGARRASSRPSTCPRSTTRSRSRRREPDAGGPALDVVAEVQQHIGRNQVRAVAMSSTDGVERGMDVVDTGGADHRCPSVRPRSVAFSMCWASPSTMVRRFRPSAQRWPIHRSRPDFVNLEPEDGDLRDRHQGH